MEMLRFQSYYFHFQPKTVLQFFEKGFYFLENLLQSFSIKNIKNF